MQTWFNIFIEFFFLLTPFFALSIFLAMTHGWQPAARRTLAVKVTFAVILTCLSLFFFGGFFFQVFGITVDAFRIGAGTLLFLSGLALTRGDATVPSSDLSTMAVVPLAIPVTVGPATTGVLLVMGGERMQLHAKLFAAGAILAAAACVGLLLVLASQIERFVGRTGLAVLSKLTGLILASMAAEMIFTGVRNLLAVSAAT